MKKITREEFDSVAPDDNGIRYYRSGDYSLINSFGEGCRFGEWCSFGEGCRFERDIEAMSKLYPFVAFDRCGSEQRKTYFFLGVEGIVVRAGCFLGDDEEFEKAVLRKTDSWEKDSYIAFLAIARSKFKELQRQQN